MRFFSGKHLFALSETCVFGQLKCLQSEVGKCLEECESKQPKVHATAVEACNFLPGNEMNGPDQTDI